MQIDSHPVFRKIITPWYDSRIACASVMVAMIGVMAFSLIGIRISLRHPGYQAYSWIPLLLILLSGFVIFSTAVRLIRRRQKRSSP
jgi:uncharacterized sodium:solute symporter family permease YidK